MSVDRSARNNPVTLRKENAVSGESTGAIGKIDQDSPQAWRHLGLCRTYPGDWFDIPSVNIHHQREVKKAEIAICSVCPVIEECANYGMNQPWGIWGGLLPRERSRWKRRAGTGRWQWNGGLQ